MKNKVTIPCIEPTRCYLNVASRNQRLSTSPSGHVLLKDNRRAEEEWYMVPQDDGVTLQSVKYRSFLGANSDGEIVTCETLEAASVYTLKPASSGARLTVQLQSLSTPEMILTVEKDGTVTSRKTEEESDSTLWEIEFLSGELCFVSNHASARQLMCNNFGRLSMTNAWGGWEVWRFIEVGEGRLIITSWTHDSRVLCSDPDGKIQTTKNKHGAWEEWTVERSSDSGVLIQSAAHPGRFLCFNETNGLFTSDDSTQEGVEWRLEPANRDVFYLTCTSRDKRLSSKTEGCVLSSSNRKDWEQWTLKRQEEGWFSISSKSFGMFLASSENGEVYTTEKLDNHIRWTIDELQGGGISLISCEFHRRLVMDGDGHLCTSKIEMDEDGVSWILEPCMPHSISGGQITAIVGASVAGLAVVVAAPFAVMTAVGALGFGAGGITGGSIAAGMMSAEAVAAGGGVVAGGTVATLQSIGAAGLGFAGTSAALGGGAVVGSVIVGSTVVGIDTKDRHAEPCSVVTPTINRPLSNWRSW